MTFPYKKTVMDNGKDGLIITVGIAGVSYLILKKLLKITSPIKFDAESLFWLYIGNR